MALERLQKLLARAGLTSRRKAEELIVRGRVSVDGRIVSELGVRADSRKSRIEVDGKRIFAEDLVYGVLHKPRGSVCTLKDPEGRPTIADLLRGVSGRVVPVGRLDFHTSGVLLFTNDGDFASTLQDAKTGVPKVYVAKVPGVVDDRTLARFQESIVIDGRPTRPAEARVLRHEGDKCWLEFTLKEGKNRQIRRLGEHAHSPILRLVRTEQAGITVEGLRPGDWRYLTVDELTKLKKQYGVPARVRRPPDPTAHKAAGPRRHSKTDAGSTRERRGPSHKADAGSTRERRGPPHKADSTRERRGPPHKADAGSTRERRGASYKAESSPKTDARSTRERRGPSPKATPPRKPGRSSGTRR